VLTAFGSVAGAATVHFGWPAWSTLVAGTSVGWIEFGTMRFILILARNVGAQLIGTKVN
jgi:hypothetical protein